VKRLYRASIWYPFRLPPEEKRYGSLLRSLAFADVVLIIFGVAGALSGVPAIEEAYVLGIPSLVFGSLVAAFAFAALIGLSFKINTVEAWAKIGLCFPMSLYPLLLLLLSTFTAGRLAVGALCVVVIPILFWRIGDLGREAGGR